MNPPKVAMKLIAVLVVLGFHTVAWACPLACELTVSDSTITEPATVTYSVRLYCPTDPPHEDWVNTLSDTFGTDFSARLPIDVAGPNFSVLESYPVSLDYQKCLALPGAIVAPDGQVTVTNTVIGTSAWFVNTFSCPAVVTCEPPQTGNGATRTIGYYKTHSKVLEACVAGGVNLGYTTVASLDDALGLLWAEPSAFTGVAKARLLLGRQLLVAMCNEKLFGAVPADSVLESDALAALTGTDCAAMKGLATSVDAFNNSNDDVALPTGLDASLLANTGKPEPIPAAPVFGGACTP
jgi:hypothetical protein